MYSDIGLDANPGQTTFRGTVKYLRDFVGLGRETRRDPGCCSIATALGSGLN